MRANKRSERPSGPLKTRVSVTRNTPCDVEWVRLVFVPATKFVSRSAFDEFCNNLKFWCYLDDTQSRRGKFVSHPKYAAFLPIPPAWVDKMI